MHKKIFGQFLFIIVANSVSLFYDRQFVGCEYSRDTVCISGNYANVKLIKDNKSEFKRCPKTSHVCMEKNSEVYLNDSHLYIFDFGALNVLDGGSVRITRYGLCNIFGRGFMEIKKNATTAIDSGELIVDRGEIYNEGSLYVGDKAFLRVISHTQIMIGYGLAHVVDTLHIDTSSRASFQDYSKVKLSGGSELRANGYNKLDLNDQSLIHLLYAEMFMANGSELQVRSFSALEVGHSFCLKCQDLDEYADYGKIFCNYNRTRLSFGKGSRLWLHDNSKVQLKSGEIVLDNNAYLLVQGESNIHVNGLLQIRDAFAGRGITSVNIYFSGKTLTVGKRNPKLKYILERDDDCYTDSSLIITDGDSTLPSHLTVMQGAHCFTKPIVNDSAELNQKTHVMLEEDSDTNEFKCFKSRDELMEAVKYV